MVHVRELSHRVLTELEVKSFSACQWKTKRREKAAL